MHAPLDIPLEQPATTRRADRRVVLLCIAIVIGLCVSYLASRLPFVISETIGLRPESTTLSMRLLKTPTNEAIITRQFGNIVPLDGLPFDLRELLHLSTHEISIHSHNQDVVAITLDNELPEETRAVLESYGYRAWVGKGKSLITLAATEVHDTGSRVVFSAFLPWYDGEVTVTTDHERRAAILLTNHQMTIRGAGSPGAIARNPSIPKGSSVILATSLAENLLGTLAATETTEAIAALTQFFSRLTTNGASLVLTTDALGQGFFATFPAPGLSVENAAAIGKDIANRENLTTLALTSEDGEAFDELIADTAAITVDISAEKDFTFITITHARGNVLRLTKTAEILAISNRAIAVADTVEPVSSCLPKAHTWANTQQFLALLNPEVEYQNLFSHVLGQSKEIAVTTSEARICW